MDVPGFVLRGAVRSKKTSQRIVTIPTKGSRKCHACGGLRGFHKILPSEAHERWHKAAMAECWQIKAILAQRGVVLPIAGPVNVEAIFYQDANRSDATGLYESLADLLQDALIIVNDKQIESWDGSRRRVDKANPRVEVFIEILGDVAVQESLGIGGGDC